MQDGCRFWRHSRLSSCLEEARLNKLAGKSWVGELTSSLAPPLAESAENVQRLRDFPEIRACIVNATGEISDVGNAIISEKAPLGLVYFYKPQGNRVVLKVAESGRRPSGAAS